MHRPVNFLGLIRIDHVEKCRGRKRVVLHLLKVVLCSRTGGIQIAEVGVRESFGMELARAIITRLTKLPPLGTVGFPTSTGLTLVIVLLCIGAVRTVADPMR